MSKVRPIQKVTLSRQTATASVFSFWQDIFEKLLLSLQNKPAQVIGGDLFHFPFSFAEMLLWMLDQRVLTKLQWMVIFREGITLSKALSFHLYPLSLLHYTGVGVDGVAPQHAPSLNVTCNALQLVHDFPRCPSLPLLTSAKYSWDDSFDGHLGKTRSIACRSLTYPLPLPPSDHMGYD